jgi:hypothetical protein
MKTALLFVFVLFSINAFPQIKYPTPDLNMPPPGVKNCQIGKEQSKMPSSVVYSKANAGEDARLHIKNNYSSVPIIDFSNSWQWDMGSNGWLIKYRNNDFVYDASLNILSYIKQMWNGSIWENSAKTIFTYNANSDITSQMIETWDGSAWIPEWIYIFGYDGNYNQISLKIQNWDGTSWLNLSQDAYTYDANNNLTGALHQSWDGTNWLNMYQNLMTYDANNNLIGSLQQNWAGTSWLNLSLSTCTYDANNNNTSILSQNWSNNNWLNSNIITFIYNAGNLMTSYTSQDWDGQNWINTSMCLFTYNASNYPTEQLWHQWNGTWHVYGRDVYTYDVNNNQTSDLYQSFNGSIFFDERLWTKTFDSFNNLTSSLWQRWSDNHWAYESQMLYAYEDGFFLYRYSSKQWDIDGIQIVAGDSTHIYFRSFVGAKDWPLKEGDILVYPNPNNGRFLISSETGFTSIEIYNNLGQLVYSNFNQGRVMPVEINLSAAGKGEYILRAKKGSKMYQRIVIVK